MKKKVPYAVISCQEKRKNQVPPCAGNERQGRAKGKGKKETEGRRGMLHEFHLAGIAS